MSNWLILPVLIPLIAGIVALFFPKNVTAQRIWAFITSLILIGVNIFLLTYILSNGIMTLELGGWEAPFGIVFVGDSLAVLLTTTTSFVAMPIIYFSFSTIGVEREKYYYYSFFQFLIAGVSGAFLTGDIFNLFVCFEVLLLASYALIGHGGTKTQLKESFNYVIVNVVSSAFFVIGVAYLYAVTGTLNMAQLSERVSEAGAEPIITVIAILFLIVFGLKGALFPLYFWLPGSYSVPPTAIGAIFAALLTKVGIYSIFRTYSVIFNEDTAMTHTILLVLSAVTMIVGVIGAIAYRDVKLILVYNVIVAVGFILFGVASLNSDAFIGAIYYLLHDIVIKAALFLIIGALITAAGTSKLSGMGGIIKHHPLLTWMFFISALALAGVPPLGGFPGKLMLVVGGAEAGHYIVVAVMMVASLLVLYSVIRIFLQGFLGEPMLTHAEQHGSIKAQMPPIVFLVALSAFMGFGAEIMYPLVESAAETLINPRAYIEAVLGGNS
ncbi:Na+/H+ antiporter subunit D [Marinococcus sp. PL1-022]|uniref:Na+/H+ antiporter subunit D n=1 Tax=Marinococcus sp. PL1-022 TaxID=3095363 RepID=UPI0029C3064F|nr:Na+/H+ antiporter subunit D [Marinococcus sp. PL1-022]MDX6153362.1 Na+/H+ antiporter subunit D [Marinococcus sp. PL1-022]